MRDLFIRTFVAALLLFGVFAFSVDWQQLLTWPGTSGTLDASLDGDQTLMRAQVAGDLVNVPVRDDAIVHRGDLLFAIDARDYQARADRATAEVVAANAEVDAAAAMLAQQDALISVANAHLDGAEANLVRAMQARARQAALLHTESYLARDWQNALAAAAVAAAAADGDKRLLSESRDQTEVLEAQLTAKRAALEAKRASLVLAQIQLGYTHIVAPFDGLAAVRLVRLGDYVKVGGALITIVPLRDPWAVANFREEQLTHMVEGQRATVTVDALPGVIFRGRVDSIGATSQAQGSAFPPDRAAGNFTKIVQRIPVKIILESRIEFATRLRPGLSVEVVVDTSRQSP